MNEDPFFIEVHIMSLHEDTPENRNFVLNEIVQWYHKKPCKVKLGRNDAGKYVRIEHGKEEEEEFWSNPFLTKLWDQTEEGDIDLAEEPKFHVDVDESELYLILKYRTNQKEKLNLDFCFGLNLMKKFGFVVTIEDVGDGFLLFYKTKEDFLISQIKNRSIKELISLVKKRGAITMKNMEFLKNNFKLI